MKVATTLALFGSVALSAAQFTFNEGDNSFSCSKKHGVAAFCAGGDIIIRCSNGRGTAGNCNDNLAGYPPFGDNGLASCYQSTPTSGDAACTKAGLIYPASGSGASNRTAPYPIPGTLEGTNSTTSARPARGTAGTISAGAIDFKTIYTTRIIVTDCGNGTTISQRPTPGPVLQNGGNNHHWANASSVVVVAPQPVLATGSLPASSAAPIAASTPPAVLATAAASTSSTSVAATPSGPTASPTSLTSAARTLRAADYAPLVFAAVAVVACALF